MKEFACGDVVPGCVAKFKATSADDILKQVAQHAHDDHGLHDISAELVAAVQSNIRDVSAA